MSNELLQARDLAGIVQANALAIQNIVTVQMNMQNDIELVKSDLNDFKNNTEIDENRKYELSQLVKDTVREIVEHEGFVYRSSSRYIFQDIYRKLKRKFRVTSYARIKLVAYEDALKMVRDYELADEVKDKIKEAMEDGK